MNSHIKTAVITATCMTVPLVWQWNRATKLDRQIVEFQRTVQVLSPVVQNAASAAGTGSDPSVSQPLQKQASLVKWEATLKQPDPLERAKALTDLIKSLSAESAPQVAELFTKLKKEIGPDAFANEHRQFLRAWGRLDGPAAMESRKLPNGKTGGDSETGAVLSGWAQKNPVKALEWFEALDAGRDKNRLGVGLIDGWSLQNFDAAAAYAGTLPQSYAREELRTVLFQRALATGGISEAKRWFDGIPENGPDGSYKQGAFDDLVAAMLSRDPNGAASLVSSLGRREFMGGEALPAIASKLAESDPAGAVRWLEALGSESSPEAYSRIVDAWAGRNLNEAGAWLREKSGHPAYGQMVAQFAEKAAYENQETARAWAATIQDERLQAEANTKIDRVSGTVEFNPGPIEESKLPVTSQTPITAGQVLQVSFGGEFYAAQVMGTEGGDVHIKYFGWDTGWDEVVPRSDLRLDPNARRQAVERSSDHERWGN